MFLAFNNGLAATADHIELDSTGRNIVKISNLQIVNGGQTTASIYHTWKKDKADISGIFVQAKISVIKRAEEFADIAAGIRMNRPVELLLADMGRRSGIQDIDQFAQVFAAAKRSGGELTDIISQTAGIIRDKIQIQEEIHTMTAARVFEQKIMNGIPFGIILYIDLTTPGFFQTMYHTWLGRICMTVCLGVYVGAVYLAKRILDIPI